MASFGGAVLPDVTQSTSGMTEASAFWSSGVHFPEEANFEVAPETFSWAAVIFSSYFLPTIVCRLPHQAHRVFPSARRGPFLHRKVP